MNRIVIIFLILAVLVAGVSVQAAPVAQENTPGIAEFTTTADDVNRVALQNRSARIPVSWEAVNRPITSNLFFEQVLPDGSAINVELPRLIPWVTSTGDGVVAPIDPTGSADEIILRVRLVDLLTQELYDESQITLPVVEGGEPGDGPGDIPVITRFITATSTVHRDDLAGGTARIGVSWTAANRPITANLIFEQVIAGTGPVNVELPRENPWVASTGDGVVAPRDPGEGEDQIWLRLRLVDLVNGRVYDQRDQFVNISDEPAPQPAITSFTTTAANVILQQLQDETSRVPVSWAVENRPANSNLVFEQVLDDGSVINVELPRTEPIVPSSGSGVAAPVEPGGEAQEIVLQLRLIALQGDTVYDTAEITLPIVDEPAPEPAITSFTTSATNVSQQQLASGTARVPVSWAVENRPANSNLVFEQVLDDGSIINVELPRTVPIVPSSGNGTAAPIEPGGEAEEIVLQVRLINLADNTAYDTAEITLPVVSTGGAGDITDFSTNATGVDATALQNREARIPVSWTVVNRPANTNLVFEQRLADGRIINVELPRTVPIVPSTGNGVTNPMAPGGDDTDVLLTLRLVNLSTNQTLDSAVLSVPIINTEDEESPGEEATEEPGNEFVNSFTASPNPADPQSTITLSWDVQNAASVTIIPLLPAGIFASGYDNQPIAGSLQHTIAEENTETAEFILSVEDAQGQEIARETLTVDINCPFNDTYLDGCPLSQAPVEAAYQTFENGSMVWRSDTNQIYVLFSDGTFQSFSNTWTDADPVDTGETPPGGLFLPVRGFGKVWANENNVRDSLGWATAQEVGYSTTLEVYIIPNRPDTIVMTTPDGRVLSIGQAWTIE